MKIGIITYSSSNTANVKRLFNNVYKTEIIEIGEQKEATDILILPGVGNFEFVKNELDKKGITKKFLSKNYKNIFGICLGMHLLQKDSEESLNGMVNGFNFGKKSVTKIASKNTEKRVHTGWNFVKFVKKEMSFLNGYYYFSHSYGILWTGEDDELAYYEINNKKFVGVSNLHNRIGVQFHPELSGFKGKELVYFLLESEKLKY